VRACVCPRGSIRNTSEAGIEAQKRQQRKCLSADHLIIIQGTNSFFTVQICVFFTRVSVPLCGLTDSTKHTFHSAQLQQRAAVGGKGGFGDALLSVLEGSPAACFGVWRGQLLNQFLRVQHLSGLPANCRSPSAPLRPDRLQLPRASPVRSRARERSHVQRPLTRRLHAQVVASAPTGACAAISAAADAPTLSTPLSTTCRQRCLRTVCARTPQSSHISALSGDTRPACARYAQRPSVRSTGCERRQAYTKRCHV
jgi:hypothetical protein